MKVYSKLFKRAQAWVLTIAMLLPILGSGFMLGVTAADETDTVDPAGESFYEGEIVADNYGFLTNDERDLLGSGLLTGKNYRIVKPSDKDELVSVNKDTWVTTAETFTSGEFVWVPVTALYSSNDWQAKADFAEEDGVYTASVDKVAGVDAFSVKVLYELKAEVDAETQKVLLDATANFLKALDNYDALFTADANLNTVKLAMDALSQLADGIDYYGLQFKLDAPAVEAVEALEAQMAANDGAFELSLLVNAYQNADLRVRYMMENNLREALEETYGYIKTISEDPKMTNDTVADVLKGLYGEATANNWTAMTQIIKNCASALEACTVEDKWALFETDVLKDNMTDEDWKKLEKFFFDEDGKRVERYVSDDAREIVNPLTFGTAEVRYDMDMFVVTVNVALKVYDNEANGLAVYGTKTTTLTLVDNVYLADIEAAIGASGIENAAITSWGEAYDPDHFERAEATVDGYADDEGKYSTNVTYTITYVPKTYTVDFGRGYGEGVESQSAYYGQILTLPYHEEAGKAYDYAVTMNSQTVTHYEGEEVTVVGDALIDRDEGKAYTVFTLGQLVVNSYFGGDGRVNGILTSGALKVGKDLLKIRVPNVDDDPNLAILERRDENTQVLTVKPAYKSDYKKLVWVAEVTVDGEAKTLDENNQVVLVGEFTRATVTYKLVLEDTQEPAVLEDLKDLPKALVDAAADQMSVLDRLANQKSTLSQLDKTKLGAMKGMIEIQDIDAVTKASLMDDISGMLRDCFEGEAFTLSKLIDGYANGGLTYYYRNHESFADEMDTLCNYLESLLQPAKRSTLIKLLDSQGLGDYAGRLDELKDNMGDIRAKLSAPHEAIDVTSDQLADLVSALTSTTALKAPDDTQKLTVVSPSITKNSLDNAQPNVSLMLDGVAQDVLFAAVKRTDVLKTEHIDGIKAAVKAKLSEIIGEDGFFYIATSEADIDAMFEKLYALVDGEAEARVLEDAENAIEVKCDYRVFELVVPSYMNGTATLTFTLANMKNGGEFYSFVLDATDVGEAYRCDFTIPGREGVIGLTDGNETVQVDLSRKEIMDLYAVETSREVTLEVVDLAREKLIAFVNNLNESANSSTVEFRLIENDGSYTIVMKVAGAASSDMASAMGGMAMGFATSGYSYVAMADQAVMQLDETDKLVVSVQAVYDAIMHSGFSTDALGSAFKADGSVNHFLFDGAIIAGTDNANVGGVLINSTMSLGSSADSVLTAGFVITVDDVSEELKQVRNLFVEELGGSIKLVCQDGEAKLNMNLPQKAYEVFVAALLMTGTIDLDEINEVNAKIGVEFVKHFIDPVFTEEASLEAVRETLTMFGFEVGDLSGYEKAFDLIRTQYNGTPITYEGEDKIIIEKEPGIVGALTSMGVPAEIVGMIESGTVRTVFSASVQNFNEEYQAIVVDPTADVFVNKIGMTDNLRNIEGTSIVILLKDIGDIETPADLVISNDKFVVLNLNGFTVWGDVVGNGQTTIVDSSMIDYDAFVAENRYSVTGSVTGATALAGRYAQNVTDLKDGYIQDEDGFVGNRYFNFVKDAEGNLTVQLDAGVLSGGELPNMKAMILDLVVDMLFNGYTTNRICIEDNLVYQLQIADLVGFYTSDDKLREGTEILRDMVSAEGILNIVNGLMDDLTDFGALKEKVDAREPIISYKLTTASWDIKPAYIPEGKNYFTMGIVSGEDDNRKLNIELVDNSEAGNDLETVETILGVLDEIAVVDIHVGMDFGYNDKNITVTGDFLNHIVLDFSSNPKYTVLMAVILADHLKGTAKGDALIEGIEAYCLNSDISKLHTAFDDVLLSQVLAAVMGVSRTDSVGGMLGNIGLYDTVREHQPAVFNIGNDVMKYAKALALALRKLVNGLDNVDNAVDKVEDKVENNMLDKIISKIPDLDDAYQAVLARLEDRTFGSIYDADGDGYGVAPKSPLSLDYKRELFKGFSVTLEGNIDVKYIVKLFRYAPVIDEDRIDLSQYPHYAFLDVDNVRMLFDLGVSATTVAEFAQVIAPAFRSMDGSEVIEIRITGRNNAVYLFEIVEENGVIVAKAKTDVARTGNDPAVDYIGTGFTVKAITGSAEGDSYSPYTVVLRGDVTGDGQTNVNDLLNTAEYMVENDANERFSQYQLMAMNITRDGAGTINVNDFLTMAEKATDYDAYLNIYGNQNQNGSET